MQLIFEAHLYIKCTCWKDIIYFDRLLNYCVRICVVCTSINQSMATYCSRALNNSEHSWFKSCESLLMTNGWIVKTVNKWKSWMNEWCYRCYCYCKTIVIVFHICDTQTHKTHRHKWAKYTLTGLTHKIQSRTQTHTMEWKNFNWKLTVKWRNYAVHRFSDLPWKHVFMNAKFLIFYLEQRMSKNINNTFIHNAQSLLCCHWQLFNVNGKCFLPPPKFALFWSTLYARLCVCVVVYISER